MIKQKSAQIRVGIFVFFTLVTLMAAIFLLGSRTQYFQPQYTLKAVFSNVGYILEGAGVYLAGVQVGRVGEIRFFEDGDLSQHLDTHVRDPAMIHAQLSGRPNREVDNSSPDVGAAIIYPHNDGLSGLQIDHPDFGAKRQALVRGGESVNVEALAACRSMIPVP